MADRQILIAGKCADLVKLALDQVGYHYLWGSAGSVPDKDNDVFGKGKNIYLHPNIPDPSSSAPYPANPLAEARRPDGKCGHEIYKPVLQAAWCRIDSTRPAQVCAGRCADADVSKRTRCTINDAAALKREMDYPPYCYLFPRPMRDLGNNTSGDVVWGEPCDGVVHFDCVGLINWCLSKMCGKTIQNEIYHYNNSVKDDSTKPQGGGYGWTVPVKNKFVDYQAGDILTDGNHHIGMVSFDGIVQAADTTLGVIAGRGYGGHWTHHVRLSDYFWTAHGGVK